MRNTAMILRFVRISIAGFLIGSTLVLGCAPSAYKITPVPVSRELDETVVVDDGGLISDKIALIDVDGIIMNRPRPTLFGKGENPVSLFVEKLDKAREDKQVKGVILRINSPGGGVTASDLMYQELQRYKEDTDEPVIAVMMDVSASGGYYIACACDELIAQPTTITGSIGVIMQLVSFAGTMHKLGIEPNAIVSGKMKDAGSPLKKLTPAERKIFQGLVDEFYGRFVEVVAKGRPNMQKSHVRKLADGRVWSGEQALELGFVDRLGSLRDAIATIKQRIEAERVRVVTYHRPLGYKANVYSETPTSPYPSQVNLINVDLQESWLPNTPQFLYLWAPGL